MQLESLLAGKIGTRPLGNLPSFAPVQADHTKQIHNRLVDLSGRNIFVAHRKAKADDGMGCLSPSELGILDTIAPGGDRVADVPDRIRPHELDTSHRQ